MADRKWTEGIRKNYAGIVRDLKNADDVAEFLYSQITPPLIRYDEVEQIEVCKISLKII